MEKLLEILEEIAPDVPFQGRTDLITSRDLTSFDVLNLIAEIEEEMGVEIPVEDVVPENFESVEAMMNLIERLQNAS